MPDFPDATPGSTSGTAGPTGPTGPSARRTGPRRTPSAAANPPDLDIDVLLRDPATSIVVCCGAGGVGKTTTAAAIGLRAAEQGRKVAVLTIDPARRLAQSMGLDELDNNPRAVSGIDESDGGSLDAMMLDMKRTFDEVVQAHASPEKAEQILTNPFYISLSSSFAGTQEYMAMEKLGQLHAEKSADGRPRWDLVIVDTPPSRSALDFLDAPARLGSFLDGRFIRLLLAPAKLGGRAYVKILSAGVSLAATALSKVLGAQMLRDVQTLVAALDTAFGGFRERADVTYALLRRPETAFLVVASPEQDALREAGYFIDRLAADGMPLAGLVVNRVSHPLATHVSASAALSAVEELESGRGDDGDLTHLEGALRIHAELAARAERQRSLVRRFTDTHPGVAVRQVPVAPGDIHDLPGLREIGDDLSGPAA